MSFYKNNIITDILQNLLPFSYIQLMPSMEGGLKKTFFHSILNQILILRSTTLRFLERRTESSQELVLRLLKMILESRKDKPGTKTGQ